MSRAHNYVPLVDAVGTLWTEAAVQWRDAIASSREDDRVRWDAVLHAIKSAWPELVAQALRKDDRGDDELDRFRAALTKIKGGHSEDPQLDAIRALEGRS